MKKIMMIMMFSLVGPLDDDHVPSTLVPYRVSDRFPNSAKRDDHWIDYNLKTSL